MNYASSGALELLMGQALPPPSPGKNVLSLSVSVAAVVTKHEYPNKLQILSFETFPN